LHLHSLFHISNLNQFEHSDQLCLYSWIPAVVNIVMSLSIHSECPTDSWMLAGCLFEFRKDDPACSIKPDDYPAPGRRRQGCWRCNTSASTCAVSVGRRGRLGELGGGLDAPWRHLTGTHDAGLCRTQRTSLASSRRASDHRRLFWSWIKLNLNILHLSLQRATSTALYAAHFLRWV
jgi:hypothetical protein